MIETRLREEQSVIAARTLRQFAAVWLIVFSALSFWHFFQGRGWSSVVFGALALSVGPIGLLAPERVRWVFLMMGATTRPLGVISTHLLLGLLFYGLFTPVALLFRLFGRDALRRARGASSETTYWSSRSTRSDVRRYLRQY